MHKVTSISRSELLKNGSWLLSKVAAWPGLINSIVDNIMQLLWPVGHPGHLPNWPGGVD